MNDITFVCCIEFGPLEDQTLLMLNSLRRHGGELGRAPVIVVKPRLGVPLRSGTLLQLSALGARLVDDPKCSPVPWFNYANKIAAVLIAQQQAQTALVAWLDSDVLVAGPPTDLRLAEDEDFAARAEFLPPAVREDDPTHVPYWRRLCSLFGVQFDLVPWLFVDHRDERIRMYFNSGVFVWRRSSGFAERYADFFVRLLKSRLAQHDGCFFTADQVVLTPVVIAGNLRWRHLGYRCHHMTFQAQIDGPIASPSMHESALIHYSKSLDAPHRERFLARLRVERPELHGWLVEQPALHRRALPSAPWFSGALAHALKLARGLRWRLYASKVQRALRGVAP